MKKLMFIVKQPGFLRYIESLIRALAQRGHVIHIGVQQRKVADEGGLLQSLLAEFPNVSIGYPPERAGNWAVFAGNVRGALDYEHYLYSDFRDCHYLRARAGDNAPYFSRLLYRGIDGLRLNNFRLIPSAVLGALRFVQQAVPVDQKLVKYIEQVDPDFVFVSGLVWPRSPQPDVVSACRELGVPCGYIVNSWDNLTNKGDIKAKPDWVFVWNEIQKKEAIRFHGMGADQVLVVGAALFDKWFEKSPTQSRESFCARVGLNPVKPYILYTCSSPRIAPGTSEVEFVKEWIDKIRAADPILRDCEILVRPHPMNTEPWKTAVLDAKGVVVFPKTGEWVVREADKNDFFHSFAYAAAVAGLNTSAALEVAIAGKRTLTIEVDQFRGSQEGTLHYRYLKDLGFVKSATDWSDHFQDLLAELEEVRKKPSLRERSDLAGAVERFIRPFGLSRDSTSIFASTVEKLASLPRPRRQSAWGRKGIGALVGAGLVAAGTLRFAARNSTRLICKTLRLMQRSGRIRFEPSTGFDSSFRIPQIQVDRVKSWNHFISSLDHYKAAMTEDAIAQSRKAMELDRLSPCVLRFLGDLFYETKNFTLADKVYRMCKDLRPDDEKMIRRCKKSRRQMRRISTRFGLQKLGYSLTGRAVAIQNGLAITASAEASARALEKEIARLRDSGKPVILGPWISEVGFEVLYWIPFMTKILRKAQIDPSRVAVVSRGGVGSWYEDIAAHYVEIFDMYTTEQFRERNIARIGEIGHQKQSKVSTFEDEIIDRTKTKLGWAEAEVVYPALMFNHFTGLWGGLAGKEFVDANCVFEPFEADEKVKLDAMLPRSFVAVKFYFRESFPDTPANRELIADTINLLSTYTDVVVLSTGLKIDDHEDFSPTKNPRVVTLEHLLKPSDNLAVQSYIISKSRGFVGTYGGMSYVASLFGKESIGFESDPQFNRPVHLAVALNAYRQLAPPICIIGNRGELSYLKQFCERLKEPARGAAPNQERELCGTL